MLIFIYGSHIVGRYIADIIFQNYFTLPALLDEVSVKGLIKEEEEGGYL